METLIFTHLCCWNENWNFLEVENTGVFRGGFWPISYAAIPYTASPRPCKDHVRRNGVTVIWRRTVSSVPGAVGGHMEFLCGPYPFRRLPRKEKGIETPVKKEMGAGISLTFHIFCSFAPKAGFCLYLIAWSMKLSHIPNLANKHFTSNFFFFYNVLKVNLWVQNK